MWRFHFRGKKCSRMSKNKPDSKNAVAYRSSLRVARSGLWIPAPTDGSCFSLLFLVDQAQDGQADLSKIETLS